MLVSAMAAVTEGSGFGLTASISFEHPYPFARRMSTLDHLTDAGRLDVVTSYLDSGAKNLGEVAQLNHDNRYDVADEYWKVCYKLWEGSWEERRGTSRPRERRLHRPLEGHGIDTMASSSRCPASTSASPRRSARR